MSVYLPCLSVDKPDNGGGLSVGVGVGLSGESGTTPTPGVSITHSDSPITLTIIPVPPFLFLGPNWQFWSTLFGLGETRIERQKEQIQDVYTSIFRYLKDAYGVPLRDNHALQFSSDGVQNQFQRRPDIKAWAQSQYDAAELITRAVFADDTVGPGRRERVVNQFAANAAINNWPLHSTIAIWEGINEAAQPECSSDPRRWLRNPYLVAEAARMAVLLQYIPLQQMGAMAAANHLGSQLANSIVLHWYDNPDLVSNITYRPNVYWWQQNFLDWKWAVAPTWVSYSVSYTVNQSGPLLSKPWITEITDSITFPRPTYPDFIQPSLGGIPGPPQQQPTPQPQPQPEPTPQPQPEPQPGDNVVEIPSAQDFERLQSIINLVNQTGVVRGEDATWLSSAVGTQTLKYYALTHPIPSQLRLWLPGYTTPIGGPVPQPTPTPTPQPTPLPVPQEPIGPVTQADYSKACELWIKLRQGKELTEEEKGWIGTVNGSTAFLSMQYDPKCGYAPNPQGLPLPPPQDPHCAPAPQPTPVPPVPPPPVVIIPQPDPNYPGQDGTCDPDCQEQIDVLRQKQEDCCDEIHGNVYPRLDNLEDWVSDLERRVPGPRPPLPHPVPDLPDFQGPPPAPIDDIDNDGEPDTPGSGTLPPEVIDCLTRLCDEEKFCEKVRECERELECREIPLCDEQGGPWGSMAECWLSRNTYKPDDVEGDRVGRSYPGFAVQRMLYAFDRETQRTAQAVGSQSGGTPQHSEQSEEAEWWRYADPYRSRLLSAWEGAEYEPISPTGPEVEARPWIYSDPANAEEPSFKVITVKPHPGEIDPCTGVAEEVLEIPGA